MQVRRFTWRETYQEGSIALFISAIFHTSLILLLALCVSVEHKPTQSAFSTNFGSEQSDSMELCSMVVSNSKLVESDESEPYGIQEDMVALKQFALSETQVSMRLKSVLIPAKTPKTVRVDREPASRRTKVTQVSTSARVASAHKALSFGKTYAFGMRQIVPGPGSTLEVSVPGLDSLGTSVLSQAGNLSLTGGAMMVSTACPASALADTPLRFSYDETKEDGREHSFCFRDRRYRIGYHRNSLLLFLGACEQRGSGHSEESIK